MTKFLVPSYLTLILIILTVSITSGTQVAPRALFQTQVSRDSSTLKTFLPNGILSAGSSDPAKITAGSTGCPTTATCPSSKTSTAFKTCTGDCGCATTKGSKTPTCQKTTKAKVLKVFGR